MGRLQDCEFFRNIRETIRTGRQIGDSVPQPVVVRELGGRCVWINPAFYRQFGYTLHDLQERQYTDLWGADYALIEQRTDDALARVGEGPQIFSHQIIHPLTGAPATCQLVGAFLRDGAHTYRVSLYLRIEETIRRKALIGQRIL